MSIFLPTDQRFPVPLRAVERFTLLVEQGMAPDTAVLAVLAGDCGIANPSQDDFDYFVERLEKLAQEPPAGKEDGKPPKRTRGTHLLDTLNGMPVDMLLLAATGNDYAAAERLYCEADRDAAMAVIDGWLKLRLAEQDYLYECVLYGFGGHYADDKPMDANAIDLSNPEVDPIAALDAIFGRQGIR